MICIECAAPVKTLYTCHSEDNIYATKCSQCHKFADSYIESDNLLVIIDLILLRPGAIRHAVFNAGLYEKTSKHGIDKIKYFISSPIGRLFVMLTLFDVYLLWGMYEKLDDPKIIKFLSSTHPFVQYLMFITLSISQTVAQNYTVRILARRLLGWKNGAAISTALVICSFFKLLPILTFIWHYDIPFMSQAVKCMALVSTVEVLSITLDCSYAYSVLFTFLMHVICVAVDNLFWLVV